MLRGRPRTAASWSYALKDAEGEPVGRVELDLLRDRGTIAVGERELPVAREAPLVGAFALQDGDDTLARARPHLSGSFSVELGTERALELRVLDPVRLEFGVFEGDAPVGYVRHDGTLNRPIEAELPGDLPHELRLFLVWPALLAWRRHPDSYGGIRS